MCVCSVYVCTNNKFKSNSIQDARLFYIKKIPLNGNDNIPTTDKNICCIAFNFVRERVRIMCV